VTQLEAMMGEPKKQLEVISPYFVPGKRASRLSATSPRAVCAAARGHQLARRQRRGRGAFGLRESGASGLLPAA
jgi:hypothetical protein